MSAIIYQIPAADKVLIIDSRQHLIYPFIAPSWLDLRLGAFISLTKLTDNDDPTGLAETLATTGIAADRVGMGFKRSTELGVRGTPFFGISNTGVTEGATSSIVEAGDVAQRWRFKGIATKAIFSNDGVGTFQDNAGTIFGPEMNAENPPSVNAGRANLIMLRMVRATSTTKTVSNFYYVKTTRTNDYADANVFTDLPTIGLIRQNLKSATWTGVLSPVTFTQIPDAIYFYWPFTNSRLRIHSVCLEKFA
jgi:hypothetical protein